MARYMVFDFTHCYNMCWSCSLFVQHFIIHSIARNRNKQITTKPRACVHMTKSWPAIISSVNSGETTKPLNTLGTMGHRQTIIRVRGPTKRVRVKTSGVFHFSKNDFPQTRRCRCHIRYAFKSVPSNDVEQPPKSEFNFQARVWCLSTVTSCSWQLPSTVQVRNYVHDWPGYRQINMYCRG